MEDDVKIYRGPTQLVPSFQFTNPAPTPPYSYKPETRWETLQRVIEEREEETRRFRQKYPAFDVVYNWAVAGLITAFAVSCVVWGVQINTEKQATSYAATALADYRAEQQAIEDARVAEALAIQNSEEAQMKKNAKLKTKVLYGARNFEEKYGYTEADLLTLCQCIDNRADFYGKTIEEVVQQPDQWVGYYESNPDNIDKYYKIALKSEQMKRDQETRPVSNTYVYAYYTERGIYLSDEFNSEHPFTWWRYSSYEI